MLQYLAIAQRDDFASNGGPSARHTLQRVITFAANRICLMNMTYTRRRAMVVTEAAGKRSYFSFGVPQTRSKSLQRRRFF
jgi:hypothetical protein